MRYSLMGHVSGWRIVLAGLILLLCLLSFGSHASAATELNSEKIAVVEIVNFACPHCAAVSEKLRSVRTMIQKRGGEFDLVPIFLGEASPWPAIVYLSLSDLKKSDQALAEHTLFQAIHGEGLTLSDRESTCVLVSDALPDLSLEQCIARSKTGEASARLKRLVDLLDHLKSLHLISGGSDDLSLPIFILEKNNTVRRVLTYSDIPNETQLVHRLEEALYE